MADEIVFRSDIVPDMAQIIALYRDARIKRPIDDKGRMEKMFKHSNLIVTAWYGEVLVGVSRTLSDFAYWSYLADLVVHPNYQTKGIGIRLIEETKSIAGQDCMLLLLSSPSALSYYPKIGFRNLHNAFGLDREV